MPPTNFEKVSLYFHNLTNEDVSKPNVLCNFLILLGTKTNINVYFSMEDKYYKVTNRLIFDTSKTLRNYSTQINQYKLTTIKLIIVLSQTIHNVNYNFQYIKNKIYVYVKHFSDIISLLHLLIFKDIDNLSILPFSLNLGDRKDIVNIFNSNITRTLEARGLKVQDNVPAYIITNTDEKIKITEIPTISLQINIPSLDVLLILLSGPSKSINDSIYRQYMPKIIKHPHMYLGNPKTYKPNNNKNHTPLNNKWKNTRTKRYTAKHPANNTHTNSKKNSGRRDNLHKVNFTHKTNTIPKKTLFGRFKSMFTRKSKK